MKLSGHRSITRIFIEDIINKQKYYMIAGYHATNEIGKNISDAITPNRP